MITGIVRGREARIPICVIGPEGQELVLDAVIDTGYTASLSLPPAAIQSLALDWQSTGRGILADGSECLFDVFEADVDWDDRRMRVLVDEADTDPLIGMKLLDGFELIIEVQSGGKVTIKPLD